MPNTRRRPPFSHLAAAIIFVAYTVPAMTWMTITGPNDFFITLTSSYGPFRQSLSGGIQEGHDGRTLHRFVFDKDKQRYFAYDLILTASGSDKLQVRIEPSSLSAAERATIRPIEPSWTVVPLLKPLPAREVKAGDELTIELVQSAVPSERVVDHLAFAR
jgi:hypothetical protein